MFHYRLPFRSISWDAKSPASRNNIGYQLNRLLVQ